MSQYNDIPQVEYKEMDDHLAHLSEDEYYSEEDRREKEKDKGSAPDTKATVEKPVIKPEDLEPEKADPDKPQPDDPTGETVCIVWCQGRKSRPR